MRIHHIKGTLPCPKNRSTKHFLSKSKILLICITFLLYGSTSAQLNNDLLLSMINVNNYVAACDSSYLSFSNLVEIKEMTIVDMSKCNIDMENSHIQAVNPIVRDNKKLKKLIQKGEKSKKCQLYNIESNIKNGKYSFDLKNLSQKYEIWIPKYDRAFNTFANQNGGFSRAGFDITFAQGNSTKRGLLFNFRNNNDWFLFDYDDTLEERKNINLLNYNLLLYRKKRNESVTKINDYFGSNINLFFRDTNIYIFEIPRIMPSFNRFPTLAFTDSLELFTYQITNDSSWYVKQFVPDTTERANYEDGSYAKQPKFIMKIKIQDLCALNSIDLTTVRNEQLYTASWGLLEHMATENPSKYKIVIDSIVHTIANLVNLIEKDPTYASQINYKSYKSIFNNIKAADFKSSFSSQHNAMGPKKTESGFLFNMDIKPELNRAEFNFSEYKIHINMYKITHGPFSAEVDSNTYIVNGKEYDRRFDKFYPFKTNYFSNACLLQNDACPGYGSKTVSGEANFNKLIGLLIHDKFMEVWRIKREKEMNAKEKAGIYQKLSSQYGPRYANAFLNMEIIVGMPKPLSEKLIKSFYVIDDYSQYKNSTTYFLTSMFLTSNKMSVTIDNTKVTSVKSY